MSRDSRSSDPYYPVYQTSKIFGLAPFSWPEDWEEVWLGRGSRFSRVTRVVALLVLFSILGIASVVVIVALSQLYTVHEQGFLDALVVRVQILLNTIAGITVVINAYHRAPIFRQILVNLRHINDVLHVPCFVNLALRKRLIKNMALNFFMWCSVLTIFLYDNLKAPVIMFTPNYFVTLLVNILELQVISLCSIISCKFSLINSELKMAGSTNTTTKLSSTMLRKHLTTTWSDVPSPPMKKSVHPTSNINPQRLRPRRCRNLRLAHAALCEIVREVNLACRVPLLFDLAYHFYTMVGALFLVYTYVKGGGAYVEVGQKDTTRRPDFYRVLTFVATLIYTLVRCLSLAAVCDTTVSQAQRTGELLYAVNDWTPDIASEMHMFAGQLLHQKIAITGWGMFNVDHTFLFTVGGAMTSYLVILIQFQSMKSSDT